MSAPDKKPVAYNVQADEAGVIVFATSGAAARRRGAVEMDTDWDGVESCRRAPQWDDTYPRGPTDIQLFESGWWFGCEMCGRSARKDSGATAFNGCFYCEAHSPEGVATKPDDTQEGGFCVSKRADQTLPPEASIKTGGE